MKDAHMPRSSELARRPARHRDPRDRERVKYAVTLTAALVIGSVASTATFSAWNAQTDNSGNTFAAGTVVLGDNDVGGTMFALSGMRPTVSTSRCIRVDYTGSLPSTVRLYGATTAGTGLEDYLTLTVTRGTVSSGGFPDCTNFTADATNHIGSGPGVLYSGLMDAYPSTWAGGIVDPDPTWTGGESRYYRFTVDVVADDAAQGKTATETFTWEAR
jgi:hypothetical protein